MKHIKSILLFFGLIFCIEGNSQIILSEIQDTVGKGYVPITDYDPALATYIQKYMLLQDYLRDSISWGGITALNLNQVLTNGNDAGGLDAMNFAEVEADEFIGDLRGAVLFKAQAGENLAKGEVVYVSGISGNTTIVSKADADDAAKMPAFGVVAVAANSGNPVDIYTFGTLSNLNTSGFTLGDILYVSTTAGQLTATPPTGESALLQNIAKVTRVDNSAGSIKISGAGRTNATPNLNTGRLFVGNASNQAVADGTIYVDIANSRVGIGTSIPDKTLVVSDAGSEIVINDTDNTPLLRFRNSGTTSGTVEMTSGQDMRFLTGGTSEAMRITSGGNLGLGVVSPSQKLQVAGNIYTTNDGTTRYIRSYSSTGVWSQLTGIGLQTDAAMSIYSNDDRVNSMFLGLPSAEWNNIVGYYSGDFTFVDSDATVAKINDTGLELYDTGGAIDIYLNPNGDSYIMNNLGIGLTNPLESFVVSGGNMQLRGTTYTDFTDYWGSNDNSAFFTPYGFLGSSGSFATSLYSNGYRNDSAGFSYIGTNGNTTTASGIDLLPTGDIYFRNGTASGTVLPIRMTIKNGGNTGIGTSNPSATLDVNGGVEIATVNTDNTTDDVLVHSSDGTVSKRTLTSIGDEIDLNLGDDNLTLTGFRTVNLSNNDLQFQMNGTGVGHGGFWYIDASANALLNYSKDNGSGGNYGIFGMSNPSSGFDLVERFNFFAGDGTSDYNIRIFDQTSTTGAKEVRIYNGALRLYDSGSASDIYLNPDGDSYIMNDLGIGTSSPSAPLHIESTGTGDAFLIKTDDATSNAAPVVTLKRTSTTPSDGDYLGQIKFKGENDLSQEVVYAKITSKISDITDGTEDGLIETAVKANGSNLIVSRQTHTALKLINGIGLEVAGDVEITTVPTENTGDILTWGSTGLISKTTKASIIEDAGYWDLSGNNLYPSSTAYNVGIGTSSPSKQLTIQSTGNAESLIETTIDALAATTLKNADAQWRIGVESFDDGLIFRQQDAGYTVGEALKLGADLDVRVYNNLRVDAMTQDDTESQVVVWDSGTNNLRWRDVSTIGDGDGIYDGSGSLSSSTTVTINGYGIDFVGSSDEFSIDSYGQTSWTEGSNSSSIFQSGTSFYIQNATSLGSIQLRTGNPSPSTALYVKWDGNIGIGTLNPDKLLVVEGVNSEIVINDTSNAPELRFRNSGITSGSITMTSSQHMRFLTGGTSEQMRITNTGLVGINITSPNAQLDVGGRIESTNYIVSGVGSGGVAMTMNDGKGNANLTFNHTAGVPEQAGAAARIEVNTDATTNAYMYFELKENNATSSINLVNALTLFQDDAVSTTSAYAAVNDNTPNHPFTVAWDGSQYFRVETDGDLSLAHNGGGTVSIGHISPDATKVLDVEGDSEFNGDVEWEDGALGTAGDGTNGGASSGESLVTFAAADVTTDGDITFSDANDEFTATNAGKYRISYTMQISGAGSNVCEGYVKIGNTEQAAKYPRIYSGSTPGTVYAYSSSFTVDLTAGQTIDLYVNAVTSTCTCSHAYLEVERLIGY